MSVSASPPALLATGIVSTRHEYETLFSVYVPIAVAVFAVVVVATLVGVVRGRMRRVPGGPDEHNALEGTYALLLACLVAFLIFETLTREHRTDTVTSQERPGLVVNVIAARWQWQFGLPAYGFSVFSGAAAVNPIVLPAGEAIRFQLHSLDVIHAFWVPELGYKHDVFPGITQDVTLSFTRTGTFSAACAQFCGLRHAEMVFDVRVVTPAQFSAWARSHQHDGTGSGTVPPPSNYTASAGVRPTA